VKRDGITTQEAQNKNKNTLQNLEFGINLKWQLKT